MIITPDFEFDSSMAEAINAKRKARYSIGGSSSKDTEMAIKFDVQTILSDIGDINAETDPDRKFYSKWDMLYDDIEIPELFVALVNPSAVKINAGVYADKDVLVRVPLVNNPIKPEDFKKYDSYDDYKEKVGEEKAISKAAFENMRQLPDSDSTYSGFRRAYERICNAMKMDVAYRRLSELRIQKDFNQVVDVACFKNRVLTTYGDGSDHVSTELPIFLNPKIEEIFFEPDKYSLSYKRVATSWLRNLIK